jgi:hypothetical protein
MKEYGMKDACIALSAIICVVREVRRGLLPFTMSFTRVWSAKTSRMYSAGARCSIAGPSLPRRPYFNRWKDVAPLLANDLSEKCAFRRSNCLRMTHIHRLPASSRWLCLPHQHYPSARYRRSAKLAEGRPRHQPPLPGPLTSELPSASRYQPQSRAKPPSTIWLGQQRIRLPLFTFEKRPYFYLHCCATIFTSACSQSLPL